MVVGSKTTFTPIHGLQSRLINLPLPIFTEKEKSFWFLLYFGLILKHKGQKLVNKTVFEICKQKGNRCSYLANRTHVFMFYTLYSSIQV